MVIAETDSTFGMKFSFPSNWIYYSNLTDDTIKVIDLNGVYNTICIAKFSVSNTTFLNANDWTMSHFSAYKLFAQSSTEPIGTLQNYDSSVQSTLSATSGTSVWAPWIYADFESVDSSGIFAVGVYQQFVAHKSLGYSITITGDTSSMKSNYSYYNTLLKIGISLLENPNSSVRRFTRPQNRISTDLIFGNRDKLYTLEGRVIRNGVKHNVSHGIYCTPGINRLITKP
jgi:hypothetical protein